jgi:hypothetical protein
MRGGILGRKAMGRLAKPARQPVEKKHSWRVGDGKLKTSGRACSCDKAMVEDKDREDSFKRYADKEQ